MKKAKPQMFSWMNPKLEVRETSKYGVANLPVIVDGKKTYRSLTGRGFGIFAKDPVRKGEVLFVMGGYVLTIEDENNLKGIVSDKPIEISDSFSIGPRKASDIPRMPQHYINHSCSPNSGFKGQIFIVAMEEIEINEEVVYDYAMIMQPNPDSNSYFQFDCVCGSKTCRKVVGENDSAIPELQAKYDGFFQYFIQEDINKKKLNNGKMLCLDSEATRSPLVD